MIRYHASWIVPITARPIRDGWVDVDGDRIIAAGAIGGRHDRGLFGRPTREIDLGSVAVLPGLVNAHTHLELSGLRDRVPPAPTLPSWVGHLLARRTEARGNENDIIAAAIEESWRAGTAVVGDISDTLASVAPLARGGLAARVFKEILGFNAEHPEEVVGDAVDAIAGASSNERVRVGLAAHAPYSVSPGVFRSIKAAIERWSLGPCSVHLAESQEELEFLRTGKGAWRDLLEQKGKWIPHWQPPGCGPVAYLDRLGWLHRHVIVVHGVHLTSEELDELARRRVVVVTCPRSNAWTGAGTPPVEQFYASGVSVAVGTDSLASAPDLNLFGELAELRRLASSVPASSLLESVTLRGAEALGFGSDFGSIEQGRRSALIAVRIPEAVQDVEEYLVSGIQPGDVRWLDAQIQNPESRISNAFRHA